VADRDRCAQQAFEPTEQARNILLNFGAGRPKKRIVTRT
jgi:hypothetical protein